MKKATIILNDHEHTITELRSRANADWRGALQETFGKIADVIREAPGVDLSDGQALAGLVLRVSDGVLSSVDTIRELCETYAPDLPWGDAYDSEIITAFGEVLKLAFPFGFKRIQDLPERLSDLGSAMQQMQQS
jgi:hypothetical protein